MRSRHSFSVVLPPALILCVAVSLFGIQAQKQDTTTVTRQKGTEKPRVLPVVDFDSPEPADPEARSKRRAKSNRYDRYGAQEIQEAPHISERVWSSAWADNLPAIPIKESDLIVVGIVTNAEAHLSNDKTAIYSDFNLAIDEVLKGRKNQDPPAISIERFGGAVRFRGGSVLTYRTLAQGMPEVGQKYLFFLKRAGEDSDFRIVTGYKIEATTVTPLDGSIVEEGTRQYVFDHYQGYYASVFLQEVRQMIAHGAE